MAGRHDRGESGVIFYGAYRKGGADFLKGGRLAGGVSPDGEGGEGGFDGRCQGVACGDGGVGALLVPETAEGQGVCHTRHLIFQFSLDRNLRDCVLQGQSRDGRWVSLQQR